MRKRQVRTGVLVSMTVGMILVGAKTVNAAVIYNLNDVTLANGDELKGNVTYVTGFGLRGVDVTLTETNGESETLDQVFAQAVPTADNFTIGNPNNGVADFVQFRLPSPLNESLQTIPAEGEATIGGKESEIQSGTLSDLPTQSVPEPGEIMGTVAALAMGVVLRGKKRMLSAKAHSTPV